AEVVAAAHPEVRQVARNVGLPSELADCHRAIGAHMSLGHSLSGVVDREVEMPIKLDRGVGSDRRRGAARRCGCLTLPGVLLLLHAVDLTLQLVDLTLQVLSRLRARRARIRNAAAREGNGYGNCRSTILHATSSLEIG